MGLGILISPTISLGIQGNDGDKIAFYYVVTKASAKLSDTAIQDARKAGRTDVDIQKLQDEAQAAVQQYASVGSGMGCRFVQTDLTAAMQKLQSDPTAFDPGNAQCAQITLTFATSSTTAAATAITSNPSVVLPKLPADATDCGSGADLSCLIQAAQSGHTAKFVYVIPPVDFFGIVATTSQFLAITGKDADKLLFSEVIIGGQARLDDMVALTARMQGKTDAEIKASADQANASIQQTVGTGNSCKYAQTDLVSVLQAWKGGAYSTTDWDKGQCTAITPSGAAVVTPGTSTQSGGGSQSFTPTPRLNAPKLADPSVVPAELKAIPVPPGFGVIDGSPSRVVKGGVFNYALADWFGNMNALDLDSFYSKAVPKTWDLTSRALAPGVLENEYVNMNDPTLYLTVEASEDPAGTTLKLKIEKR
jgi:hypothetical protein